MTALPPVEDCVIPQMLARRLADDPDSPFAMFADGTTWSIADTAQATLAAAAGLRSLGVGPGDTVLSWLPNGADAIRAWFGANQLGAIYVPVNTQYLGDVLAHVVRDSRAEVAVVHADLLDRLAAISTADLRRVVVVGGTPVVDLPGIELVDASVLTQTPSTESLDDSPAQPWDPYAIIYTSGTTGPSKGVVSSYVQMWATGVESFRDHFRPDDRMLAHLPLFHAGGTIVVYAALWARAGAVAVIDRFDTETFWETVRHHGVTVCTVLGVMATFLMRQPARPDDANNPLRIAYVIPLIEEAATFGRRFGCDIFTAFNMTETSCPLVSEPNPTTTGSCGRPRPGCDVRLVDEHDREVGPGEVGELIVRTDMPWAQNSGYWRNPEATAAAWRNGWFHTGDGFRVDADGQHHFVDRMKDALRRRGENISSFEVEAQLLAHPAVLEAAAIGVPSAYSEDDVMVVLALAKGASLAPDDLIEFLDQRLPRFMIPRYVRIMQALPKTPTSKVMKHALRTDGVTDDTWDRQRTRASRTADATTASKGI